MTVIFMLLLIYAILCAFIYSIMQAMYISGKTKILKNAPRRWMYYLLSFTWGLPMNVAGLIVASVLLILREKPKKYGWNYCFELNVDFGLELGIFFISPKNGSKSLKNHEHGHSIQNIYLGPLAIGVVSIPSAVRFWNRKIRRKLGKSLPSYDSIWFEGQATISGTEFINSLNKKI